LWRQITAFGVPARAAAEAALRFTDIGDIVTGWTADGPLPEARGPCELYPEGQTYLLIASPGGTVPVGSPISGGYRVRLINLRPEQRLNDALIDLGFPYIGMTALIDLNATVARIDAELAKELPAADRRRDEIEAIEDYLETV
jgi:hypothetical protein